MPYQTIFTLSGSSLLLGGILATLGWLPFATFDPEHKNYRGKRWYPLNYLVIAGGFFMALGLPGFYLRQASQVGIWGLIGYLLLFIGITIPYLSVHSIETVTMPDLPAAMMKFTSIGAPSIFLGLLITGIVTAMVGYYPFPLGVALILSPIMGLLTVSPGVPPWLGRNAISAVSTLSLAWAGFLTIGF